ncbi:hypothetical protein EYF80_006688 [Liparis tanakae]|uniref:Uncharacterized protein n=1 Tax=Liparis tanakae TaxID=230148 RepID=A0A4Z2IZ70_9TELE|nr:hypothetical protein EYF80_006688 [Liparis tanakae]
MEGGRGWRGGGMGEAEEEALRQAATRWKQRSLDGVMQRLPARALPVRLRLIRTHYHTTSARKQPAVVGWEESVSGSCFWLLHPRLAGGEGRTSLQRCSTQLHCGLSEERPAEHFKWRHSKRAAL